MPLAIIHKMGSQGELYNVHFLDQNVDPGYGQGRPGGRPDQGLPGGGGHPDQGLPGMGGRPDQGLPGGGHISNRPPGSGGGGIPDNELPDTPPPQLAPGYTLVLIRHQNKWTYAAIAPGSPPPRPLPGPGGGDRPDQGLPGSQPQPDQGLPGGPPGHASGQPVPPQPTPTPPMAPGSQPRPGQPLPPTAAPKK